VRNGFYVVFTELTSVSNGNQERNSWPQPATSLPSEFDMSRLPLHA